MRLGGSVFYKGTDPEQYALAHQYAGLAFREKFSIIKYPVKVHMQSVFPYKGRKNLIYRKSVNIYTDSWIGRQMLPSASHHKLNAKK